MSSFELITPDNPNGLDPIDTAEFTLSQPGYNGYSDGDKARMLAKLGRGVLVVVDLETGEVA